MISKIQSKEKITSNILNKEITEIKPDNSSNNSNTNKNKNDKSFIENFKQIYNETFKSKSAKEERKKERRNKMAILLSFLAVFYSLSCINVPTEVLLEGNENTKTLVKDLFYCGIISTALILMSVFGSLSKMFLVLSPFSIKFFYYCFFALKIFIENKLNNPEKINE